MSPDVVQAGLVLLGAFVMAMLVAAILFYGWELLLVLAIILVVISAVARLVAGDGPGS